MADLDRRDRTGQPDPRGPEKAVDEREAGKDLFLLVWLAVATDRTGDPEQQPL